MNAPVKIDGYAEIGITTNFSFLRGGSDPVSYTHLTLPTIYSV